ncbi:transcriptional regulator [Paucibacter oligotrophus]|uniref:Transcriptional regulator n=1 Tax=Roseateles oligotrophus TaxID=1769250 RepID=A0A840L5A5_9BURK|nr:FMN-binding negative transcriptional regulator [Roseateles oligotrophus]MBB4841862.1 transcriptional regulator [Roseateles oligotrophus]
MYQPAHFRLQDDAQIRHLLATQPLAAVIGPDAAGQAFVSHLPLTLLEEGGQWLLEGHMARANPHWAWLSAQMARQTEVLAVFSGPSAYVSPRHYEHERNVPTWNYLAVHAYGTLDLVDEAPAKDALLKRLIQQHEPGYAAQWRGLAEDFQSRLLAAIVGFRLRVTRLEAKAKLSQNRSALERQRIQAGLSEGSASEQAVAQWMQRLGL